MSETKHTNRWLVMVFGMICMLVMGICYTYSLFQPYVMTHFGVDSPSASLPYTIFIAVFCLGNFLGGLSQRKFGIRWTLIIGYILMFLGWLLTAFLPGDKFWAMYLTFGGLFGIGDGMVYNVIVALMPKWFPDKKGLASGLTLAMLGMSATVFSPVVSGWLTKYGFKKSFMIVAFVYLAIGIFGTLTMKNPPEGFMMDYVSSGAIFTSKKQYEVKEVFRVKEFWTLMGLYFCAVPAYLLLSGIFVTYGADRGLTAGMATLGVSAASLFQVAGRFVIPTVSDKIGRKSAFAISFLVTAVGVALLTFSKGYLYVLCFCLISFSYGGSQACFAPIAADRFGTKNLGTILSLTMIGFGAGSIGASLLAKVVGSTTAFICAGAIALIGILLVLTLPNVKKIQEQSQKS
ncbi:MAG: OFA family MFS transporter [Saccharofermentanales bacterium]